MAKKTKEITRGVFNVENLVSNVKGINKKLSEEVAEVKTYNIYIHIDEQTREKFDKNFSRYIFSVRNLGTFPKKLFFRLMLEKYKEFLESQNLYFQTDNESIIKNLLSRKGQRTGRTNAKPILFGTYQDNTLEIFQNISYSIARSENMENVNSYKKEYFFVTVLDHFVENIDIYIKEANK
ncbi:MAG: hypothetical protein Q4A00_07830 [Flavobacteriaceae bacterium]|nr:hypothetical protein [Flavobacteriaceae bacterium]